MHILEEELYQCGMALAGCPTAPFHEGHVLACLEERLSGLRGIDFHRDEFGNLHASYRHHAARRAPFRLVAHMDHPAFIVPKGEPRQWLHFGGGVAERYFVGKQIVLHNLHTRDVLGRAKIIAANFSGESKRVQIDQPVPADATFACWDLPPARCTKKLFIGPACDDLVEVAVMLALLRRLALTGAKAHVHALFTRAEETGFAGAFAAMKAKTPLPAMPTISLEASQARGFARVEGGPVVRVGDRTSIFDSRTTHWLETAFRDLALEQPSTVHQRLLMGGGTCEATVFCRAGLPTGAMCVALNNYHNMGPGTSIRSESISLRDWQGLLGFLHFLATKARSLDEADAEITKRLAGVEARGIASLRGTPSVRDAT